MSRVPCSVLSDCHGVLWFTINYSKHLITFRSFSFRRVSHQTLQFVPTAEWCHHSKYKNYKSLLGCIHCWWTYHSDEML